jgi:hypothetical protein
MSTTTVQLKPPWRLPVPLQNQAPLASGTIKTGGCWWLVFFWGWKIPRGETAERDHRSCSHQGKGANCVPAGAASQLFRCAVAVHNGRLGFSKSVTGRRLALKMVVWNKRATDILLNNSSEKELQLGFKKFQIQLKIKVSNHDQIDRVWNKRATDILLNNSSKKELQLGFKKFQIQLEIRVSNHDQISFDSVYHKS